MGEEGDDDGPWFVSDEGDAYGWEDKSAPLALIFDPLPDLSDPATIGCLLALVRDAWDEPAATIDNGLNYAQERWWWVRSDFAQFAAGQTEAEALVSAMEAAP